MDIEFNKIDAPAVVALVKSDLSDDLGDGFLVGLASANDDFVFRSELVP